MMHSTNNIPSAAESGTDELHSDGAPPLRAALPPLQPQLGLGQRGSGDKVAFPATAPAQRAAAREVCNG